MRLLKKIGAGFAVALVGFIALQFVPVSRTNPPITQSLVWDSDQTRVLVGRACLDCHSNETKWPFYASIAPVSWLLSHHVNEGRANMNFSEWDQISTEKKLSLINKVDAQVKTANMPPGSYLLMHPEAQLTDSEKSALIDGLTKSIKQ